jgi:hypothetical protein
MKKMMFLISTEGKTIEQISSEAKRAWNKFNNETKLQTEALVKNQKVESLTKNEK